METKKIQKIGTEKIIDPDQFWFGCWTEIEDMMSCWCERCTWNYALRTGHKVLKRNGKIVSLI